LSARYVAAVLLFLCALVVSSPARATASTSVSAAAINPCAQVTGAQASRIVGKKLVSKSEALLGPTCIYSFQGFSPAITLVVESVSFSKATAGIRHASRFKIHGRTTVCGILGRQNLFTSLPHGKVLNITTKCALAKKFAEAALAHLGIR
jgi:hypothetical protein